MSDLAQGGDVALHAGFWRRGAAATLDALVLVVPNAMLAIALGPGTVFFLAQLAVIVLYFASMHSSRYQATPGKRAFGIKVTNLEGGRIGPGNATARSAVWWLLAITLGIGFVIAAFMPRKQGLHDILCGTLVVNRAAPPGRVPSGGGTMPLTPGVWAMAVPIVLSPFALWALLLSGMH